MVFPLKYRKKALSEDVEKTLIKICKGISERYEIHFVEVGSDTNHVHFLVQSVPVLSVEVIARTVKSITAKGIFLHNPEVKQMLWGGSFWTSGYYANTVGQYGNEKVIRKYLQEQGKEKEYKQIYRGQLRLFDD